MKTRHEILMEDPEYRKLYAIEGLVTDAAELVARLMQEQGLNKAQLARRLGKSRAWVTHLLGGKANMTMRTFAEVIHLLGAQACLSTQPQPSARERPSHPHPRVTLFKIHCGKDLFRAQTASQFAYTDSIAPVWATRDDAATPDDSGWAA